MIQEIEPHKFNNQYRLVVPKPDSIVLYYKGHTVLAARQRDHITFPTVREMAERDKNIYETCTYLFSIDEVGFYLADGAGTDLDAREIPGYDMADTEIFRTADPKYLAFAGITGHHLYSWYQNHRYCGKCRTELVKDTKERMLYCNKCHQRTYPRINPAVIIGLTDGNRILMSKYAGREYKKYALLAGFSEIGETVEETVRREVMEEVGLEVKNVRYYKSQPWPFSETLLLGFYCDLSGDAKITLDRDELELAQWFEREDIPVVSTRNSLTNEMIMQFKNNQV